MRCPISADKFLQINNLRAVLFDLDDTLRVNSPHPHEEFIGFVASLGLKIDKTSKENALRWGHAYWANSNTLLDDYQKHNGYEDPFWQNYTRRHLESLGLSNREVEEYAPKVHAHMRKDYRPESKLVPHCIEILDSIRNSGILVGLLTNRSRPIYREILDLDLDHHLDFFLTAGQVGAFKPEAELFIKALDLIKIEPKEAIYVGDNYFADIIGAQKANLQPILIDPKGLYPEADCPRIKALDEILELLQIGTLTK